MSHRETAERVVREWSASVVYGESDAVADARLADRIEVALREAARCEDCARYAADAETPIAGDPAIAVERLNDLRARQHRDLVEALGIRSPFTSVDMVLAEVKRLKAAATQPAPERIPSVEEVAVDTYVRAMTAQVDGITSDVVAPWAIKAAEAIVAALRARRGAV